MLDVFVKKVYGEGTTTRLRPSYFPFTEPSVEVDCSCFECGGKGCKLCKGTGWIEILGAGIVNKKVLETAELIPISTADLHSVSVLKEQLCLNMALTISNFCLSQI